MNVCVFLCVQANLVIQEGKFTIANAELMGAQAQLDEKQAELDHVQAKFDASMKEKQVGIMPLCFLLSEIFSLSRILLLRYTIQ